MENCLVSKLKANVNNPNIPVFETMLQHTLDAITLSGNASMTDEQKWALNHLFWVLNENNIMSKLTGILLPIICSSKTNAQNDFKSLSAMIAYANTIQFGSIDPKSVYNDNGASQNELSGISLLDNANLSAYMLLTSPLTEITDNGNYGLSVTVNSRYYGMKFRSASAYFYSQFGLLSNQYLSVRAYNNNNADVYAIYSSISNHDTANAIIDIKGIDGNSVKTRTTTHPVSDAYVDTTGFTSAARKYLSLDTNHVGIYIFSTTNGLTQSEMEIINEAAFRLKNALTPIE